jgi:hypothetical protein
MIKRFQSFVKSKLNENVEEIEDLDLDLDLEKEDLPELSELGLDEIEVEEEEEGLDIYVSKMKELADMLGVEVDETNKISYEGKEIIFPSETEMFHVDRKKFKTAKEVVDYLKK